MLTPHPQPTPLHLDAVSIEISGRRIVHDISLSADGDIVGLVGPNGSGKSTLLRAVYRLLRPTSGQVVADGKDVWSIGARQAARITAAIVQDAPSDLELTVAECVRTGRVPHSRLLGADTPTDGRIVQLAMETAGVAGLAERDVTTLSGGERQRVHLARALAQQPRVLVLDEPTNHLDVRHQLEILALVRRLAVTVLITLHDLNLAAAYCDRVVVLSQGSVVATGTPADTLTPDLLWTVFGVRAALLTNPLTGRAHLAYTDGTDR